MRVLFVVGSQHGLKAVALEQGQIVRTGHAAGTGLRECGFHLAKNDVAGVR